MFFTKLNHLPSVDGSPAGVYARVDGYEDDKKIVFFVKLGFMANFTTTS
ncbi:hypothetical protein KAI92_05365 [Candidatus Parcubacteria bacterium]|nr:hypothetical protein [Candidatus Parcubacteria bacterium]